MFGSEIAHRCEECLVESGEVMERKRKESIESMCHHGGVKFHANMNIHEW